ncbi:MAG TPA: hypothetical protein VHP14_27400 [Anaerolineales bacterium]|nr:hypothetical protein [Anaerolineales bacterium]
MGSSFREQRSRTQESPKSFFAGLKIIATNLINWLARLISLTEEEREDAGIYRDHPGGE